MGRVRATLNRRAVLQVQTTTGERLARKGAQSIATRARRYAPKKTGKLAASIQIYPQASGVITRFAVASFLEYSAYQEFGTGIHGPKGRPITPKNGTYLVFTGRDGSTVFARSVKGAPAVRYMAQAWARTTVRDFL